VLIARGLVHRPDLLISTKSGAGSTPAFVPNSPCSYTELYPAFLFYFEMTLFL